MEEASSSTQAEARRRLSKAEKRAVRAERMKEKRYLWRQRSRETHRLAVLERQQTREAKLAAMSDEERALFLAEEQASRDLIYTQKCEQSSRIENAFENGLRVAIDLSYAEKMSAKEQTSLSRQLTFCWGVNRRALAPVSLHFNGLSSCPPNCLPKQDAHLRWKVHCIGEDVATHFSTEELVYLSPDAETVLTELDHSKVHLNSMPLARVPHNCLFQQVYVIGGLVDMSVQKATSLSRAQSLGIASARLPLNEFATVRTFPSAPTNWKAIWRASDVALNRKQPNVLKCCLVS